MYLKTISMLAIVMFENFIKGSAMQLNPGSHWIRKHEGFRPTTPPEDYEMSLIQCIVLCSLHGECKAVFYTSDSRQCHLQETIVIRTEVDPLQSSLSSVYYENENASITADLDISLPEFQTVLLDNNDFLKFRFFLGDTMANQAVLQKCSDHGGRLVQVLTLARQTFFMNIASVMAGNGPFWFDMTNKNAANYSDLNGWTTEDGQVIPIMSSSLWAPGFPINEDIWHCTLFDAANGNKWKNVDCLVELISICEI